MSVDQVNANIRAEMARHKYTQRHVAGHLGIPEYAVSRRMNGHTRWTLDEFIRLAQFLRADPATLLRDH